MMPRRNRVREAHREGRPSFGVYARVPSPTMIQLLAFAGLDYVRIDMSAGELTIETVREMIRGAHAAGITPFVRVPRLDADLIGVVLGLGALGIVVPEVQGREDVALAVRAAKMAPVGDRRIGTTGVDGFGQVDLETYAAWAADNILLAVQIETRAAVEDLDAIVATPGLDMVLGGRGTLARHYGTAGQRDHPAILEIETRVMDAAKRAGKMTSVTYFPLRDRRQTADVREWVSRGIDCLCLGSDGQDIVYMYRNVLRDVVA
jgi:2-keto-3-deoxy-L-rhamnonate aldolase RhmA